MMKDKRKEVLGLTFMILFLFGMCYFSKEQNEPKKKLSKKEIKEDRYFFVDRELASSQEKVVLLSVLKNIPKDSIMLVMREYLINTENDSISYKNSIDLISEKYNVPLSKVAGIVFSYKYETLTKEDIENSAINMQNQYFYNENSDRNDYEY
jgi:hypothetical protein